MSGRVGVEQTPDIEAQIAQVLDDRPECEHERRTWRDLGFSLHCFKCDARALAPVLTAERVKARAAELREEKQRVLLEAALDFRRSPNVSLTGMRVCEMLVARADRLGSISQPSTLECTCRGGPHGGYTCEGCRADRIAVDAPEGGAR